jgi:hypothetical protein
MELPAKRPEPANESPERTPATGAPSTDAAYATRKDLSVRVSVRSVPMEAEELKEEGYGHGV